MTSEKVFCFISCGVIKTKQFEGNLILNSIAVTIGMLAIVTSTTDLVMPSTYILGISIFTMTYSMIDLITKDDVPMFKTKIAKLRVKVYGTILSVPSAFGLTLLALNFNTPEEEIARQSNSFTLIALSLLLISIATQSTLSYKKDEEKEADEKDAS